MLRAGPIHIAVIDAAPQCTFHHDELHLAQPFSGIVVALVWLLRILRVSELSASPRPAPHSARKSPRPAPEAQEKTTSTNSSMILRSVRVQDQTHSQRRHASRKRAEHRREHVKFPSTWSAWRLCAGDGDACREHADWLQRRRPTRRPRRHQETGRGRVRRGERPSHHRSWTQSPQHRGRRRPGLRVQKARRRRQVACEPTEAAWRARETRERRSWGGGTGGQHLVAKPVTSPDSARATEPRKPEAVLELRRGARLGSGAGERERVRAREEADVRVAERNKDAATSWLGGVVTEAQRWRRELRVSQQWKEQRSDQNQRGP